MNDERELLRLCGLMVDGNLDHGDARRLAELLEQDSEARALYRNIVDVHARLLLQYEEAPAFEESITETKRTETGSPWWQFAAAAALVLFTGLNAVHSAANLTAARELAPPPAARMEEADAEALADGIGLPPGEIKRMLILSLPAD